jgi:hypothetical protein
MYDEIEALASTVLENNHVLSLSMTLVYHKYYLRIERESCETFMLVFLQAQATGSFRSAIMHH